MSPKAFLIIPSTNARSCFFARFYVERTHAAYVKPLHAAK
jgi:hypothetical protein